ncbi:MAG TPA: hypothetical protein VGO16_12280 [Pseudonocardiaceae bacterium]|nr:hypothetical protein [Pseudonocardiaceae bacterium]
MTTRRVGSSQLLMLLIVALSVLGAVIGGLLGWLIFPSLPIVALAVIMLVGAGLSALVVSAGAGGHPFGGRFRDVPNPGGTSGPPGGGEHWAPVSPQPQWAPVSPPPQWAPVSPPPSPVSPVSPHPPRAGDGWSPALGGPVDAAHVVLPVDPGGASGGQWWGQSSPQHQARPEPGPPPPAPDLASYVDSARIVQCPRCGEFRIDVAQAGSGYAFRCRVDDHRWEWQAGTPWPTTIKVSQRRPDPRRDDQARTGRG